MIHEDASLIAESRLGTGEDRLERTLPQACEPQKDKTTRRDNSYWRFGLVFLYQENFVMIGSNIGTRSLNPGRPKKDAWCLAGWGSPVHGGNQAAVPSHNQDALLGRVGPAQEEIQCGRHDEYCF